MINVGFCIAYDWNLLRYSLPLIYKEADRICFSVDKDKISWSGNRYNWDEEGFRTLIDEFDTEGKITVLEEDYHLSELSPMENEVRQRNLIAKFIGTKGWHIQLDTDEYFIDFPGFVKYLKSKHFSRPVNICCPWITLFKKVDQGYLWIKNDDLDNQDIIAIATNSPEYQFGRRNGNFNIVTNYTLLHQSWARESDEIAEKLKNWGHTNDFELQNYFNFWKTLTEDNYQQIRDFHPIQEQRWQKLEFQEGRTIPYLINTFRENPPIIFPRFKLWLLNSIWISRARKLLNIMLRKIK